ncbi:MAG: hypothetical protein HY757_05420 [Nitrospirae bacterium]|nr:hypothetical protein [Nitrospirota bacterium]
MVELWKHIKEEWPVIRQTPRLFIMAVLMVSSIIGTGIYWFFSERMTLYRDKLHIYEQPKENVDIPEHISESALPQNNYGATEFNSIILMPKISKFVENPGISSPTSSMQRLASTRILTGTLYEDDFKNIRREIMVGDLDNNKEFRGFISFNILEIPFYNKIITAELFLSSPYTSGNMNSKYFNTLLIDAIYIGDYLDKTDFNSNGIIEKNNSILFKDIGRKPLNVTKEIIRFLEDGRDIATFRLRFTERTDSNNVLDKMTINEDCKTMLLVKYK